jgi:hypoxanthine phosphoribosyltransferase
MTQPVRFLPAPPPLPGGPPQLIPPEALATRVRELGRDISIAFADGAPELLVLMDGAFVFAADLARAITLPGLTLHFRRAASYRGTTSTGTVALEQLPDLSGRRVLLVDDILDTGRTLALAAQAARQAGAASVEACVLLDKPARRVPEGLPAARFVGFTIEDVFVVGYGLDHDGRWRHLPYVGIGVEIGAEVSGG